MKVYSYRTIPNLGVESCILMRHHGIIELYKSDFGDRLLSRWKMKKWIVLLLPVGRREEEI